MKQSETRYRKIISTLYEILELLHDTDNLVTLLPSLFKIMEEHMELIRGMITIFNRESNEIVIKESFGLSDDEKAKGRYLLGEGVTGKVVSSGVPIVVPEISKEPYFLDRTGSSGMSSESPGLAFICVPILWDKDVIGTISALKKEKFIFSLEDDQKLLSVIASIIAQAVKIHQTVHEENTRLKAENEFLQKRLQANFTPPNIIGRSNAMRQVYQLVAKISQTPTTVLILGESGVGKELVADAIHTQSSRKDKPFVKFNCAALPENLIESELFGYEKGAFTGAVQSRIGKFVQAAGGSIFLDEVGELSLAVQSKLLRVLQEKEVEPLGGNKTIKVDVRIIAATNKDLEKEVEDGRFRTDLFFRLNVFPIVVPPLRRRKTDILLLADFFIEKYNKQSGKTIKRISTPAIDMLVSYHWPGNIRELENCIERAVILAENDVIHAYDLPPSLQLVDSHNIGNDRTLRSQLEILEYELIIEALKKERGNMSQAAKELGLTLRQIRLRIEHYKIDVKSLRKPNSTGRSHK
ncbi:MAG: sigma 54-interacting transcriptional regulator [Spirochaetales bacterium]|nr:sigma 54-interacting transcriptional regulator [Spirochaetales bacterium]